jgi:hypothetical protein
MKNDLRNVTNDLDAFEGVQLPIKTSFLKSIF